MREQLSDSEGRYCRHEHHHYTRVDTRHAQRQNNLGEHVRLVRAQVLRCLDERTIHLLQRIVDGVDHERQVVVAHTEQQGALAQRQAEHMEQLHRGDRA